MRVERVGEVLSIRLFAGTGQGTRKLVMSCSYGNGSVENSDCELRLVSHT